MTTPVKIQRRQKKTSTIIGREGKILAWTIIRVAANTFSNQAPYPVAMVDLGKGERLMGQLVDCSKDDLRAGKKVVAVLRRASVGDQEGVISYVIKFRPL